jgi:AcrR family transcriptional regulator
MVRKPKRERKVPTAPPPRGTSDRSKAIEAMMVLLSELSFEQVGLAEVAGRAGTKLSQLRAEFGSTLSILAAHFKDVDRAVLEGIDAEMEEEPARERLFDVLMRRLEALAPYKDAVRSVLRSAKRNPGLALALNAMAVRSQQWMLEAAGIGASGPRGALRAQGAALMFARVLTVWVDDEEEGLDHTMAALDRGLASAVRWAGFIDDLCSIPKCMLRGPRRRRRPADEGVAEADAA